MNNLVAILTTLVFMYSSTLFPHKQLIHQYITREAFQLLIMSHPQLANSEMATYVGSNQTSTPYDKSWGAGKIVSGAWREDIDDPVWNIGGSFARTGGKASAYIARWLRHTALVEAGNPLPTSFQLKQNYPNPFNNNFTW